MSGTDLSERRARYQSFVVRVFFDESSRLDHGQVTHVGSLSRESFSDLDEAPVAMRKLLGAVHEATADRVNGATFTASLRADAAIRVSEGATDSLRRAVAHAPAGRPTAAPITSERSKLVQRRVKRAMDVLITGVALLVLAIPMAVIAAAIRLDSRGPIIYRQQRATAGGRIFTMYKFRSMHANADDMVPDLAAHNEQTYPLFKIRNDPRKTRVGRVLRRFSLDELPQLFNVLKGDLSLVGPRPPLATEIAAYEPDHWRRLAVPQGMTGLWQVSGRSLLDFEEMLQLDTEYIATWSLASDIVILLRTIPTVLSGKGAF